MKAEINEAGILTVCSETPLESYAIRKWLDENIKMGPSREDTTINTKNLEFNAATEPSCMPTSNAQFNLKYR